MTKVCTCGHPDCFYCGLDPDPLFNASLKYASMVYRRPPSVERLTIQVPSSTISRLRSIGVSDDKMGKAMLMALEDLLHRMEYDYFNQGPAGSRFVNVQGPPPDRPKEHGRCLDCDEFDHSQGDHCLCGSEECEAWQSSPIAKLVKDF